MQDYRKVKKMTGIYELLKEYGESDAYPFHMPGHKRQTDWLGDPFAIDITEIDGFDNLHHAEGIIKEAQECLAALRGSKEAHFLVNGSTCGILSAVSACTEPGGELIMARNCHKAVYHAAYLRDLQPVYLYPEQEKRYGLNGGLDPEKLNRLLLEHPKVRAVVITSPTYDGIVSDVEGLAAAAHRHGIPLIVDEAHGAHFGFHGYFPISAVSAGADIVIQSFHKTLPSLTQTAVLFVNGSLVETKRLERFLGIYQTSSPSYIFMAVLDRCVRQLSEEGPALFEDFSKRLAEFRREAEKLKNIRIPGRELIGSAHIADVDLSKLVLSVKGITGGADLSGLLRENYGLELEMAAGSYALALTSFMDTEEGFERLLTALKELDKDFCGRTAEWTVPDSVLENEGVCRLSQAWDGAFEEIELTESEGRISAEFLYLYPPGIPLIVPGERISRELLQRTESYRRGGLLLQGSADYSGRKIRAVLE